MTKYLIRMTTTCSTSDWYETNSKDEAIKQAEIDYENMEDFGDIVDVNFEVLEERDE